MLQETHPNAVQASPNGERELGHEALREYPSNAPLSDEALDTMQGGISGAGIGGVAGGALGVVGVVVLAAGSGVVAVASAPVLVAGAVVGGVGAAVGAGVGALASWIKGS